MYIGRRICILSVVWYLYQSSDIYIGHLICISDVRYLYWSSDIYIGALISISELWYLYRMSDIYIGCLICILDVWYLYQTSDIYVRAQICISAVWYLYLSSDMISDCIFSDEIMCVKGVLYICFLLTQMAPHTLEPELEVELEHFFSSIKEQSQYQIMQMKASHLWSKWNCGKITWALCTPNQCRRGMNPA